MFDYIILGTLQGIFEWIPISSEGIIALSSEFLKKEDPIAIALFLHLGTLLAVLIYFRKDWQEVLSLRNPELLRFLAIATTVSLIVGYLLYDLVKGVVAGNALLIMMGFGLLLTAYFQKKEKKLAISFNKLAVISGFLQGLAVIPGLSRSGSTIFGLSLGKNSPSEILKISYMMSAPVVLVSGVYLFLEDQTLLAESWPALIFSFLVGLCSLHFLIKLSSKINFFYFALFFGLFCLLGAALGFIIK